MQYEKVTVDAKEFVENNLDIVTTIAHKFEGNGIIYDDLVSIGCIGLIKAANTISEKGDIGIYTYTVKLVEEEMLKFFSR